MPGLPLAATNILKHTASVCPLCLAAIPAVVRQVGRRLILEKSCPQHGDFRIPIASDIRRYHLSHGDTSNACGASCGCHDARDVGTKKEAGSAADPFEHLSTCIALIEIVDSCNLPCPTCYASSPIGTSENVDCTSFDEFARRVGGVLERKGFIDILQLSGGEPTIHPEFFKLLEWALRQEQIGYILINTNAIRIAADAQFREQLCAVRRKHGKFELYVQFDGPQETGQRELRGGDFRAARQKAIDLCGAGGVPTTLAMTVTPENLPYLGDALRFGLERPHVRGVTFQPMFQTGRGATPCDAAHYASITVADVVDAVVCQSAGIVADADFTPLPCGDPNCHTIGYLLRTRDGPVGLSRLVNLPEVQGFLQNRIDYRVEDLTQCGCESEPLGKIIRALEISPDQPFRMFIKPFMDAWTYDQDRIDRCCTHVIRPDGRLDSFCRYYMKGGAAAQPFVQLRRENNGEHRHPAGNHR